MTEGNQIETEQTISPDTAIEVIEEDPMAIRLTSGFGGAYIRQGHDDVGEPVDGTFVVNVALPLGLDRTDTYTGREEVKAAIRGAKYARLVPLSETPWEDDGE